MKDKYIEMLEQAGFRDVEIIKESQYSFEDIAEDPGATVIVADKNKNTEELKKISELDEERREMVKDILESTSSISVSATKP